MGIVYFFRAKNDENLFKIGFTKGNLEKRFKTVATSSPHKLEIFRYVETELYTKMEKYFHHLFDNKREENGEFFRIHPAELNSEIDKAIEMFESIVKDIDSVEKYVLIKDNDKMIGPEDNIKTISLNLRKIKTQISNLDFEKEILENKLKNAIGENKGIEGIATWKTQTQKRFNAKQFETDHPELYQKYISESNGRVLRLI